MKRQRWGGEEDGNMIRAIIELELVHPYKHSLGTLVEFCSVWDSTPIYGGTKKRRAMISMPSFHFKTIFGQNPRVGTYNVPKGTGKFIESLKVKNVLVR